MNEEKYHLNLSIPKGCSRLHLSEAPFILDEKLQQVVVKELDKINEYPEAYSHTAAINISSYYGVKKDNVIVTNGCDELLFLVLSIFCKSKPLITTANSYPGYKLAANALSVPLVETQLVNFCSDIPNILREIEVGGSVALINNPHNPTGTILPAEQVQEFIVKCNNCDVLPIIDEAYVDFTKGHRLNYGDLLYNDLNFISINSCSKSHGLAGIRLGYGIGSEGVIERLSGILDIIPFNVNRVSQRLACELFTDYHASIYQNKRLELIERRDKFHCFLDELNIWHSDSNANFIFMQKLENINPDFLLKKGFLIRDCSQFGLPGYWRVSIGSQSQMNSFRQILDMEYHS